MNPIQIIFFDIDGTLVDMQTKRIPAKTLEALVRLKAKGIKLCIATGRSPISVPTFAEVDFDAFLTFNGAYCYDRFGPIYRNPIQPEAVAKILQNAAAIKRPVAVATGDRLAANGLDADLADFSPLTGDKENLYLSKADHAAMLEIDENGVTGAAYTELGVSEAAAEIPDDEIDFVLDRPFLFLVTGQDGSLLFSGVVRNIDGK